MKTKTIYLIGIIFSICLVIVSVYLHITYIPIDWQEIWERNKSGVVLGLMMLSLTSTMVCIIAYGVETEKLK